MDVRLNVPIIISGYFKTWNIRHYDHHQHHYNHCRSIACAFAVESQVFMKYAHKCWNSYLKRLIIQFSGAQTIFPVRDKNGSRLVVLCCGIMPVYSSRSANAMSLATITSFSGSEVTLKNLGKYISYQAQQTRVYILQHVLYASLITGAPFTNMESL